MSDAALRWDDAAFAGDLVIDGGGVALDDGLQTAILLSLFTDARAPDDAELPQRGTDRRGWWGNGFPADRFAGRANQEMGSLLWLLSREKVTGRTVALAKSYALDALQWLVRDRVASSVAVEVETQASADIPDRLAIGVIVERPEGPSRQRYDFTWEASL